MTVDVVIEGAVARVTVAGQEQSVALLRSGGIPYGPGFVERNDGINGVTVEPVAGGPGENLPALLQRIRQRQASPADLAWAGVWIRSLLGGKDGWDHCLAAAANPDEAVDMRIRAETAADLLLPWETLHDGTAHALLGTRSVAITRELGTQVPELPGPRLPLRVLFVIGALDDDPRVRAAAEYYTLFRRLEVVGRRLRLTVLPRATAKGLEQAVARHRPDVVHLATHGEVADKPLVHLRSDDGIGTDRLAASDLATRLTPGGLAPPRMVILNACETAVAGQNPSFAPSQPFAADLVSAGVPMTVGMAGPVEDGFCRAFAYGLFHGLTQGTPPAEAIAVARREARAEQLAATGGCDWVLPMLFTARDLKSGAVGVDERLAALDALQPPRAKRAPPHTPVGAADVFAAWERLVAPSAGPNPPIGLVLATGAGRFGRSFLLKDLFRRALATGHVPLWLPRNGLDSGGPYAPESAPPAVDLAQLVDQVSTGITRVHTALGGVLGGTAPAFQAERSLIESEVLGIPYGIAADAEAAVLALLPQLGLKPTEPAALRARKAAREGQRDGVESLLLPLAIRADLAGLAADIASVPAGASWAEARLVVLVDDLHAMDAAGLVLCDLAGTGTPDPRGLGTLQTPVRYVFTLRDDPLAPGRQVVGAAVTKLTTPMDSREVIRLAAWDTQAREAALWELLLAEEWTDTEGIGRTDGAVPVPDQRAKVAVRLIKALENPVDDRTPTCLPETWRVLDMTVDMQLGSGRVKPATSPNARILGARS